VTLRVNAHEAKTHLLRLLARVEGEEEVVIARAGRPIARLVPISERPDRRMLGTGRGTMAIAPDFEAPLPESVLREFEG